jgi:hypothetical protein
VKQRLYNIVQLLGNCKYAGDQEEFDADVIELSEIIAGDKGILASRQLDVVTNEVRNRLKNARRTARIPNLTSRVTFRIRNGQ